MHDFSGENNPRYKTGLCMVGSPERRIYTAWQNMKARCLRPNSTKFKRYGGRGITICDDWIDIEGFYKWAKSSGWSEDKTLDRIDIDGNYEPLNCQWISMSDNSRKKRTTKISFDDAQLIRARAKDGESEYALAEEYGVVHGTVWFIVNGYTHVPEGECTKKLKQRNADKL